MVQQGALLRQRHITVGHNCGSRGRIWQRLIRVRHDCIADALQAAEILPSHETLDDSKACKSEVSIARITI